jgi:hypothetical protein
VITAIFFSYSNLPFFTHCTPANVSDDAGLIEILTLNIAYFQSEPVATPKITIMLDHAYHPEHLIEALKYKSNSQPSNLISATLIKKISKNPIGG